MSSHEEDDEIEKIKALSLITAKEDEQRRQQKYGGWTDPPVVSTGHIQGSNSDQNALKQTANGAGSLISRPRPVGRGVSREGSPLTVAPHVPAIPPRPDRQHLDQARQRHVVTQKESMKKSTPPPLPSQPPSRVSVHAKHSDNSTSADEDKPLIMLASPIIKGHLEDFDLESLDPLKNKSALHEPVPRPSSAQGYFSNSISSVPHSTSTDGFSTWADFSDKKPTATSGNAGPLPYTLNPLSNQAYGFNQQQFFPSSTSQGNLFSGNSFNTFNTNQQAIVPANGPFYPNAQTFPSNYGPPKPTENHKRQGKLSLSPSYNSSLVESANRMSRIPSDSDIVMATSRNHAIESITSQMEVKRIPSIDTFERCRIPSDFDIKDHTHPESHITDVTDLMSFAGSFAKDEQYLSLESFDPLFSMDKIGNPMTDSQNLFADPFQTPNKALALPASISTQDILQKVNKLSQPAVKHYNQIDTAKLEAQFDENNAKNAENNPDLASHKRSFSNGSEELLDPFSISDLTTALEKKRRKHAKEQEERKALMRKKEPSKTEELGVKRRTKEDASIEEKRKRFARSSSTMHKDQESTYETLQSYNDAAQDEVKAFCDMVARLKLVYAHTHACNDGFLWATRGHFCIKRNMTVKVVITGRFIQEPFIFTPSLEAQVGHLVCETLLSLADNLESTSADDYVLKVHGKSEYLANQAQLGEFEYVHNCLKIEEDIKLVLVERSSISKSLLRTSEDDGLPVLVPKQREIEDPSLRVTRDKLNILTETYYGEVEKLRDAAIQAGTCSKVQCKGVIQAVKAICATLYKIETVDIVKSVQRLQSLTGDLTLRKGSTRDRESFVYVTKDGSVEQEHPKRVPESDIYQLDDLHVTLEELTCAVKGQIDLFCRTFQTDFRFESAASNMKAKRCVSDLKENLLLHVATVHRVHDKVKADHEEFKVKCGVYYAGERLCPEVWTQTRPRLAQGLRETYVWDEWIQFDTLFVNNLPREARLVLQLIGIKSVSSGDSVHKVHTSLGWVALQLFNHKFELVQGGQLLGLWVGDNMSPTGTSLPSTEWTSSMLLQINLPDFEFDYCFPSVTAPLPGLRQEFSQLHPMDQDQLCSIWERDPTYSVTADTRSYLWEKRNYLLSHPGALPRVLQSVPAWKPAQLREIYSLMGEWSPLQPVDAMQLLLPTYPDTFVRTKAVEWISTISDDEILDYMPQLIQALKFESYHTCALARMLVEKCITSPRVAHEIYWLLKEAADDIRYRKRYQLVFGALLSVVGEASRSEFGKEEQLVKMLAAIATKVKASKEKENVLQRELHNMWEFFEHASTRLPLNPAMHVTGLDVKSCSYFSSNAFPLKLVFRNIDPKAEPIYTMFKSGDDLRQDMLTMQMIRIMDKLWLKDNLDLRIVTFRCQATGLRRGFVELVTESETLRKIQIKHGRGVAGSFKDTTIREWLQIQNPTQLEYEKAVDNFTSSCAGYCVATYLLGICDRHNDNIMVKHSGHLFHIDFGKFLGDSQMFGNIKRDRTPFVLTSDMAYVINGGDKMSPRFQRFIDYCCTAFNILRKHSSFFINLFQLMVLSRIPGVNEAAIKYVQRALLPDHTDAEATAEFTRMIEESLKSTFTQFNFFIHNLAQMKFSGHTEGALLSFIPKTYSIDTDGKIKSIELAGYQKRYNPEKYYIYIIKIERENQKVPCFIFRRFSEFQELHQKLVCLFPLVKLPSLSNKMIIGRTHIKTVAEERKQELQVFLRELLALAPEISEHDVVYTFCHPMLRDEQDINKTNIEKLREPPKIRPLQRKIDGQIKLSIFHKQDELTVMIMHVKDLAGLAGSAPDPYVKLYLLPDPFKETKRKTKIVKSTFHPTYNEMLTYRMPMDSLKERTLSVSVWNFDSLKENEFLGSVMIPLVDLTKEPTRWYPLAHSLAVSSGQRSPLPHSGMLV